MLLSGSAHTFEIPEIWSVASISSSMREAASVIKKGLYQEEASCESIATTESVALHWRNDSDPYDISIVQGWTIGMPIASPSFPVGRQGCFSIAIICKKVRVMLCDGHGIVASVSGVTFSKTGFYNSSKTIKMLRSSS